jgi:mRNA-degrading endonuclease toxin of MazEF toxin-antitoxin module
MNTPTPEPLDAALTGLKAAIMKLPPKTQLSITEWIVKWSNLISREKGFNPEYMPYFKRGDIVYVDLGFNVGSEHGGIHYAVIYDNNNSKKNKNVVIIPLSSVDDEASTSKADVFLGENIIPWTPGVKTVAKPNQIRSISKMRILKPLVANDKTARLKSAHLNEIDNKLKVLLLKPAPTASKNLRSKN